MRTLAVLYFFGAAAAFGYGNAGHEAVGAIAEHYLEGTNAGEKVKAMLNPPRETLGYVATWADRAKLPEKYLSDEMKHFVENNPTHHEFHYCDVPFQEEAYKEGTVGTNPDDIVHTMRRCIAVLQNPEHADARELTPRVALMLLAHLVGDIHQPLHVGTSYVDKEDNFVNPNTGAEGQEDAGGNYFKLNSSISLHGYWDTTAVKAVKERAPAGEFAEYLMKQNPPKDEWKPQGSVETWPEEWATEIIPFSRRCFDGITILERKTIPADEDRPEHFEWKVQLPPGYDIMAADLVELELAKAGYRLAEMLKAIWP